MTVAPQPVLFVHAAGDPRQPEGSGKHSDYLGLPNSGHEHGDHRTDAGARRA